MRHPKPWFRASKSAWYVQYRGKKVPLGEHPEGAQQPKKTKGSWNPPPVILDAFYKLMSSDPANLPKADQILVAQVADLFLSHAEKHNERDTYRWYKHFLQSFCKLYGRTIARELKPIHVTQWLDASTWKSGKRNAVIALKRAFNWADQQGVLSPNPLRNVQKPPATRRTRIVTPAEREEILAAVPDRNFKEFLTALYLTGCRPSEVSRVTAANVNLDLGVWVFDQHKTGKKTGKPRIIYLSPEMVEISRRLVAERPEGPLFPSRKLNRPFSKNAIRCRFRRLRKKLPHLKGVVDWAAIDRGGEITRLREVLSGREDAITEMRRALDNLQAENARSARAATLNHHETVRPAPCPAASDCKECEVKPCRFISRGAGPSSKQARRSRTGRGQRSTAGRSWSMRARAGRATTGRRRSTGKLFGLIKDVWFAELPQSEGPTDDYRLFVNELMRLLVDQELFTFVTTKPVEQVNGTTKPVDGTDNEAERTHRGQCTRILGSPSRWQVAAFLLDHRPGADT